MIESRFRNGILLWGFESNRICKVPKKAIRVICGAKYNAHTEPLLKELKICDLFSLTCLSLYFKHNKGELPEYLQHFTFPRHADIHNYPTRQNESLVTPFTRLCLTKKCIRRHICRVVNDTPADVLRKINTHSLRGFILFAKTRILNNYTYLCNIRDCYICG